MRFRQIILDLTLATAASALVASGVHAQSADAPRDPVRVLQVEPDGPESDARRARVEVLRAELQEYYEQLFELQMRYQASGDNPAALDSLDARREELRDRVDDLSRKIEEENEARREATGSPPRREGSDVYLLFEQLGELENDLDPEEIGRIFEQGEGLEKVLAIIGEQLKDLEVDISPERVRIETGAGGKVSFTVPEELREEMREGMREIGREFNRAFPDSAGGARNWAELLEQIPERVAQGWPDRRPGRRKVIAESAFSMGTDFEVAEDEIVQGDVLLIGADAYVSGEVQGNVYVLMGDVLVEERGLVAKDAISAGGRILVDDRAEVLGRRVSLGDASYFNLGAGGGPVAWAFYAGRLVVLVSLLLLIYALFSDRMDLMVRHAGGQPGRSLLVGAIWFTCIFGLFAVASVGLVVSVIGIPVVLVLAVAMGVVSMMAYLTGCELVGRRLIRLFRPEAPDVPGWQGALIGVLLLELTAVAVLVLGSLGMDGVVTGPLTGLQFVLGFMALSLGFGSVVQTRLGRRPGSPPSAQSGTGIVSAGA